jgi:endoglucanase
MLNQSVLLKTHFDRIHNPAGENVFLRGVGLGGWMNMENFITGFPGNEEAFRKVVGRALGEEKAAYFFERFLDYFFGEDDAAFIRSLGFNLVRLAFNYRHFEDDMHPFVLRESGFRHLDRVIEICAKYNLYTILDLHAAPGYQNQDWHSDNPSAQALFWQHRHFQDRAVWLWEIIAERYKDNPWVAGYNLLNEPSDPSRMALDPFYRRAVAAIRQIDPHHIVFLEGNRYAQDFDMLGEPVENAVYALHDYATPGYIDGGDYPGVSRGEYVDKACLRSLLLKNCQYMLDHQVPIWIGEFGPVYTGDSAKDVMRYQLLEDQLSFYREIGANWCLWTYKDIGLQGPMIIAPDSKWLQKIQPVLARKAVLGVDSWGSVDQHIRNLMEPVEQAFQEFFPTYNPFPFGTQWQINRVIRHILLAEPLLEDFYPLLQGLSYADIDELMAGFKFKQCLARQPLCQILEKEMAIADTL